MLKKNGYYLLSLVIVDETCQLLLKTPMTNVAVRIQDPLATKIFKSGESSTTTNIKRNIDKEKRKKKIVKPQCVCSAVKTNSESCGSRT